MLTARAQPIVCFSYLAAAQLWRVPQYPPANSGASIEAAEYSIAADAPMAAAVLVALDAPTLLIANNIGTDHLGGQARTWLEQHNVPTTAEAHENLSTPSITVIADGAATRTWFAHLPGVVDALQQVDLSPVHTAAFVYVDAYELIEKAAVRVVAAARAANTPVLINLGGSPLSDGVRQAVAGYEKLLLQTNVDDDDHAEAPVVARTLLAQTEAAWVVVTAGASGAVAVSRTEEISVPAFSVVVRHTHCAGAAFSGGLLYGLWAGWPMERSMVLGSASGALRCAREQGGALPTLRELEAFIAVHGQTFAS
ncbi:carbohydrate kinase family protein [Nocardia aurantia]|uniref:5-dehydro-2-deoxygluconokinase n=1 Tax=Nocardia aurantia TaxID=2585199 RepID=A0A7K0DJW9_9NOCA|nr:carbohydrate kinase family protein [Nocardia aurantia]MQY26106.1 5-dehydro-2-deoxygluconokinase [Nocardia aurantia]